MIKIFGFRLLKVFNIIQYDMEHIHTISTEISQTKNTYVYKTILSKLEK